MKKEKNRKLKIQKDTLTVLNGPDAFKGIVQGGGRSYGLFSYINTCAPCSGPDTGTVGG